MDEDGKIIGWRIRVDVAGPGEPRKQKMFTFRTKREATQAINDTRSGVAAGVYVAPARGLTVADLVKGFTLARGAQKPSVAAHYVTSFAPLLKRHGKMPAHALSFEHVARLRDDLLTGEASTSGRPLAPRSANAVIEAVSLLYSFGLSARLVSVNPAVPNLVGRVKDADSRRRVEKARGGWTGEHLARFRQAVTDDRLRAAWLLSALGLRRSEVLGLRDTDLTADFRLHVTQGLTVVNGRQHIGPPKTSASERSFTLPADVVMALAEYAERRDWEQRRARAASIPYGTHPDAPGLAFVDPLGNPLNANTHSRRFKALCLAHGLPVIPLHGVRHAVATDLEARGVPLSVRMALLGHESETVHRGYVHASQAAVDAAVSGLFG